MSLLYYLALLKSQLGTGDGNNQEASGKKTQQPKSGKQWEANAPGKAGHIVTGMLPSPLA